MKKQNYIILAIAIPLTFWFTPNLITKVNFSKTLKNIELFDNGTVCANKNEQQVYFRAFPREDNSMASSFLADNLCQTLRERKTFDEFYGNLKNRIEMWKDIIGLN